MYVSRTKIRSNTAIILRAIVDSGMTVTEAAKTAGIGKDLFGRLLRGDCLLSIRTACRLKRAFGDRAVEFVTADEPQE